MNLKKDDPLRIEFGHYPWATLVKRFLLVEDGSFKFTDLLSDMVVSGLVPADTANLTSDISAGLAYVTGKRVVKKLYSKTYAANKDTWVDIDSEGEYTFPGADNTILVDDCEAAWDELVDTDVAVSLEETIIKVGSSSIKLAVGADVSAGDILATGDMTALDLSGANAIRFWIRSSVNTDAGDYTLLLDETAECVSPSETINVPALTADTWKEVEVDLIAAGADLNAIISIGLKCVVDKGAHNIYLDDVQATITASVPSVTADSIRVSKVVTDSLQITGVTDMRQLDIVFSQTLESANIDQDLTEGSSPTFDGDNITGIPSANSEVVDAGGYFADDDVEEVLQSIGASLDDLGLRDVILGIKFEGLPASTAGTRMAGAVGKTFRVNAGSMDLTAYPTTDIRNSLPFSGIRTAKVNDTFVVQAYVDEPGFAAASGHIMTWIPKFYTRIVSATEFYIRPVQASGYTIEPAFYDYANSEENDGIWIGSLPGTLDSADGTTELDSLLGKALQVSRTMPQLRTSAKANGTDFWIVDIATRDMLRKLILIAMADTDSQTVIGGGVTSEAAQVLVSEANMLAMGNESGYIGVDTDVPVCFFGIWDLWGNIWQWADGIFKVDKEMTIDVSAAADTDVVTVNGTGLTKGAAADWQDAATLASAIDALADVSASADGNVVTAAAGAEKQLVVAKTENAGTITIAVTKYGFFYTYDETYYDAIIATIPAVLSNYEEHAENPPVTNGYQGAIAGSPAVPSSLTGGGSATGFCDYFYQATGYRGLPVGGSWGSGANAGFFYWIVSYAPSYTHANIGSRLLGKP